MRDGLNPPSTSSLLAAMGLGALLSHKEKGTGRLATDESPINELDNIVTSDTKLEPQPTASFQRVIQRSIVHVQSSGKNEDT